MLGTCPEILQQFPHGLGKAAQTNGGQSCEGAGTLLKTEAAASHGRAGDMPKATRQPSGVISTMDLSKTGQPFPSSVAMLW